MAVAIPDPDFLLPWAKERGLPKDMGELCRHPQVLLQQALPTAPQQALPPAPQQTSLKHTFIHLFAVGGGGVCVCVVVVGGGGG